jgi:DNA-binding NarL/FixJ family response regulator
MSSQTSATPPNTVPLRRLPRALPTNAPVSPNGGRPAKGRLVRIVVAEREWFVREALASVFSRVSDLYLIGRVDNAERALELVDRLGPEVVIVEPQLPEMGGLELARRLRDRHPRTAVIVMTTSQSEAEVIEALQAGASGYVVAKDSDPLRICETVRLVAGGATLLSAKIAGEILTRLARASSSCPADDYALTPREREVLALVGDGLSNRQIGSALFITERSVKNHVRNIFLKLGVANRTSAAILARSQGLAGTC